MDNINTLDTPLGKSTEYPSQYTPSLLCPIPRWDTREELDFDSLDLLADELPFHGVDYWNAYELSWLNLQGKPQTGAAEFQIPCTSKSIVESKSLKLYLNSLNQTPFASKQELIRTLEKDLSHCVDSAVMVKVTEIDRVPDIATGELQGTNLDQLNINCDTYQPEPAFLATQSGAPLQEMVYSHLLRTNCPVTNQPDWGSVIIRYQGAQIDHEGLLKYIVSYRQHQGFHEQVVEQIFVDIMSYCRPAKLSVYARFTRRGGIDINPFRSNYEEPLPNARLYRQ